MINRIQNKYFYIIIILIGVLAPKYLINFFYFDLDFLVRILSLIEDGQYFPIIYSVSNFDISPTFLDIQFKEKIISFPILNVLFHSIFYNFFGISSFIFLEFFFTFIFILILFILLKRIFREDYSIFVISIIFLLLFSLNIFLQNNETKYFQIIYQNLEEFFGSRMPRPLVTGPLFIIFLSIIQNFNSNIETDRFKFFLKIILILSLLLNTFFYYFLISVFILIFIIFNNFNKRIYFSVLNKKNILLLTFYFFCFNSFFLFQVIFGETDYSKRIGVIDLNLDQRFFLLKIYFENFLRIENLLLLLTVLSIHYLIIKIKINEKQLYFIKSLFYFVLSSIFSMPFFFLLSPKIISLYHFININIFSYIFYIYFSFLSLFFFLIKKKIFNFKKISIFIIFIFFILNLRIEYTDQNKKKMKMIELNTINNFIIKNNYSNSEDKLFSDSYDISNLWLYNNNKFILISDGFTNSLQNKIIEFNFFNTLKYSGMTEEEISNLIGINTSLSRDSLWLFLFNYLYQANSLYTFSGTKNYDLNEQLKIRKTSPFRVQSQIVPKDEKLRLLKYYKSFEVQKSQVADLVIVKDQRLKNYFLEKKKFKYLDLFETKNYLVLKKIN